MIGVSVASPQELVTLEYQRLKDCARAVLAGEGVKVEERTVRPEELDAAVEIFNTGNYGKVLPCTRYESRMLQIGKFATLAKVKYWEFAAR